MITTTHYQLYPSPLGDLIIAGSEDALCYLGFPDGSRKGRVNPHWVQSTKPFKEVCRQLTLYFKRQLSVFDLPLAPAGTAFQQRVWQQLQQIPYGETVSYGDIATALSQPTATRAVGNANGANPIPIIIPCHRVIGSNGNLTGFGGGLPTKRFLLQLEATEQLSLPL